ncbi:hypothetical protein CC80DRAFT_498119 [Byssothecium circinans]|uniref:DUF1989 domain-containing protein n=1 Tax=Byssothecium circinans TaxID=147558 RepID=A0A6A5TA79_9PLEO|nr:hypothetical protein CC80DRAFT_498119 [Byssothecium circinans]
MTTQTVPARRGTATLVRAGQSIKIINTFGTQVVDTWAFAVPSSSVSTTDVSAPLYPNATPTSMTSYSETANTAASAPEYMSMSHTRAKLCKLTPTVGDTLVSQKRAPMVKLVEDTSPGVHDTLIAACDRWRYSELGVQGYHESCTDNCWDALFAFSQSADAEIAEVLQGLQAKLGGRVPDPFNLFMNIPVSQEEGAAKRGLSLSFEGPVTKEGDYVVLRAERDLVVVMSACPQDVLGINGKEPKEAHFQVLG